MRQFSRRTGKPRVGAGRALRTAVGTAVVVAAAFAAAPASSAFGGSGTPLTTGATTLSASGPSGRGTPAPDGSAPDTGVAGTGAADPAAPGDADPDRRAVAGSPTSSTIPTDLFSAPTEPTQDSGARTPAAAPAGAAGADLRMPELSYYSYRGAAMQAAVTSPQCRIGWNALAAVGKIASDHGSGGRTDVLGTLTTPMVDGAGAAGPMKLPPGAWDAHRVDGNVDGVEDVQNVFDASFATAAWMCEGDAPLREPEALRGAFARFGFDAATVDRAVDLAERYRAALGD